MSTGVETHPVFVRLAAELMPRLKEMETRLKSVLPGATVSVFSGSVGAATSFNGAQFGIECLLPEVADGQSDDVAFTVTLCQMDREPRLAADVCWGHPTGHVEASLSGQEGSSDRWPLATEGRIQELLKEATHLLRTLEQAAQRGHP